MTYLLSKLFLAWNLILHLFKSIPRLFVPQESQVATFQKNFWTDHPNWFLSEKERDSFARFSQCIQCGTCELDCHMLRENKVTQFKPSWVAVTCTRYTPDFDLIGEVVDVCGNCPGCTVNCPTNVPIKEMAEFVVEKVADWQKVKSKHRSS